MNHQLKKILASIKTISVDDRYSRLDHASQHPLAQEIKKR
jgi:hypothetical protein